MSELREKVARAIFESACPHLDWAGRSDAVKERYRKHADAVLSIARPAIIEEAQARIATLESALEPFAEEYDLLVRNGYLEMGRPWPCEKTFLPPASDGFELVARSNGFIIGHSGIGESDLRKARAALHPKGQ